MKGKPRSFHSEEVVNSGKERGGESCLSRRGRIGGGAYLVFLTARGKPFQNIGNASLGRRMLQT